MLGISPDTTKIKYLTGWGTEMTDKGRFEAIKEDLAKAMVSRDSFAREELHRTAVHGHKNEVNGDKSAVGCDWCGGHNSKGYLYKYHVETDGGSKHPIKGKFCSKDCMETYHG